MPLFSLWPPYYACGASRINSISFSVMNPIATTFSKYSLSILPLMYIVSKNLNISTPPFYSSGISAEVNIKFNILSSKGTILFFSKSETLFDKLSSSIISDMPSVVHSDDFNKF